MHNLTPNSGNACSPFVHFSMPGGHFMDPQLPRVPVSVGHGPVFPQMQPQPQQHQHQHQEQQQHQQQHNSSPSGALKPASTEGAEAGKRASPPGGPQDKDDMDDHFEKQLASYMNCKHCDYICKQRDRMIRHVKNVHLKEKPFVCLVCNHCFGRKDKLKRHQLTVHSTERPYKCEFCSHSCNRKDKLKAHVQGVHFKSLPTTAAGTVKFPKPKKQRNATSAAAANSVENHHHAEYKDGQGVDLSKENPLLFKHS